MRTRLPRARTIILFGGAFATAGYILLPRRRSQFVPALITGSQLTGENTRLLTVTVPRLSSFKPICSIFIKDDDIQVERPYTPLEGVDEHGRMAFWIKRYPDGEVSRWVHSKKVGETIEVRGPVPTWEWVDDVWDEVIMVSGGTGITPFYQLFHSVITGTRSPRTRFTLLHSSRCLPPGKMLDRLVTYATKHPERFKLHLFVDNLDGSTLSTVRQGRIERATIEETVEKRGKVKILVCGPEKMVKEISGPFGRNFSQGNVGGILGEMGFSREEVHKFT